MYGIGRGSYCLCGLFFLSCLCGGEYDDIIMVVVVIVGKLDVDMTTAAELAVDMVWAR